ncbi:MAG: GNAT family N-acetyltransferase [Clostridiales bacterium]|nr:GNAT family N-acetyltransferase [Clostridiales bacterium]
MEIKKLTPALLEDYLRFFETEANADNPDPDWYGCYCVCWCSADHRLEIDDSSPEKRRDLAIQYINSGIIQGYLAYAGSQVAGWCNANTKSECLHCISWLRFMTSVKTTEIPESKVKSVYCFTIAPQMKRKGIATQLLERVCKDARDEGFDCVEAYPKKTFVNEFQDFMGPMELYKKFGFAVYDELEDIYVVRKPLK